MNIKKFNNDHAVGTPVTYYPASPEITERGKLHTTTRSTAFLNNNGVAGIFINNKAGYVSLDHIRVGHV